VVAAEIARLADEEHQRARQEEVARLERERHQEEKARMAAEEKERKQVVAAEVARLAAEEHQRAHQEEETRLERVRHHQEEEARMTAARLAVEEQEQTRQVKEAARLDQELARQQEEEAKLSAKEEERKRVEAEASLLAAEEEVRTGQEKVARLKRVQQQEEEARLAAARLVVEEQERARQAKEKARLDQELARQQQEAVRLVAKEKERKRVEAEAARLAAEEEELKRRHAEALAARQFAQEVAYQQKEAARLVAEEGERKWVEAEESRLAAKEEERKRRTIEAVAARQLIEGQLAHALVRQEKEAARLVAKEDERVRVDAAAILLATEEAERKRRVAEVLAVRQEQQQHERSSRGRKNGITHRVRKTTKMTKEEDDYEEDDNCLSTAKFLSAAEFLSTADDDVDDKDLFDDDDDDAEDVNDVFTPTRIFRRKRRKFMLALFFGIVFLVALSLVIVVPIIDTNKQKHQLKQQKQEKQQATATATTTSETAIESNIIGFQSNWGSSSTGTGTGRSSAQHSSYSGSMIYARHAIYLTGTFYPDSTSSDSDHPDPRSSCWVGHIPISDSRSQFGYTVHLNDPPLPAQAIVGSKRDEFVTPDSFYEKEQMSCSTILYDTNSDTGEEYLVVGGVNEMNLDSVKYGTITGLLNVYERGGSLGNHLEWTNKHIESKQFQNPTSSASKTESLVRYPIGMVRSGVGKEIAVLSVSSDDHVVTDQFIAAGINNDDSNYENSLLPPGIGMQGNGVDGSSYVDHYKRGSSFYLTLQIININDNNDSTIKSHKKIVFTTGVDVKSQSSQDEGNILPTGIINMNDANDRNKYIIVGSIQGQPPKEWDNLPLLEEVQEANKDGTPRPTTRTDYDGFVATTGAPLTSLWDPTIRISSIEKNPYRNDYIHGICSDPISSYYYVVGSTYGTMPHNTSTRMKFHDQQYLSAWVSKIDSTTQTILWTTQLYATHNTEAFGCDVITNKLSSKKEEKNAIYVGGTVYSNGEMMILSNANVNVYPSRDTSSISPSTSDTAIKTAEGKTIGMQTKSAGLDDVWIAQLDTTHGAIQWMKQIGSSGNDRLSRTNGVQTDTDTGDCIVYGDTDGDLGYRTTTSSSGSTTSTTTEPKSKDNNNNNKNHDIFVVKLKEKDGGYYTSTPVPTSASTSTPTPTQSPTTTYNPTATYPPTFPSMVRVEEGDSVENLILKGKGRGKITATDEEVEVEATAVVDDDDAVLTKEEENAYRRWTNQKYRTLIAGTLCIILSVCVWFCLFGSHKFSRLSRRFRDINNSSPLPDGLFNDGELIAYRDKDYEDDEEKVEFSNPTVLY